MKKYVIAFIVFCLFLIGINDVYGATVNGAGWGFDINHSTMVNAFDCSSSSNCSTNLTLNTYSFTDTDNNFAVGSYASAPGVYTASLGMMWATNVSNMLKSGYLYNATGYFCNYGGKSYLLNELVTANNQDNIKTKAHPVTYLGGATNVISNQPYYDGSSTSNYTCSYISVFFVPSVNSQYIGWNITTSSSSTSTQEYHGYTISELGIYNAVTKSDIQSAISGSGLATAQSVQDVEDAVQDVSNNIDNTRQQIINNQNENTQQTIDSQKVCKNYDKNSIVRDNFSLNQYGNEISGNDFGITDYILVTSSTVELLSVSSNYNCTVCFYNVNKELISCLSTGQHGAGILTLPSNTTYARFTINKSSNQPQVKICTNGNQAIAQGQQDINNTLNNSDSSGATSEAGGFFSNFSSDTHGLTGIITAPLSAIQGLINNTCSPLVLPLPFVNRNLTLPCLSSVYSNYFGNFFTMYQTITLGIVSYWVLVRIFALVKDFKNPDHDEVEVVEL